ncbi:MAG: DUF502 domain-containing protein [Chitinispirillaceae bacterium]|nr:DUF502 domain-containing protein [Chitinispirillaceae bacterium]
MIPRIIKRYLKQFRTNMIAGALIIIPFAVTLFIVIQLFQWLDSALPKLFGIELAPGLGIVIILVIAYLAGVAAKNYFGKQLIALGNNIIASIPFLNKIFFSVQQIIDMVSLNKKQIFEKAVLVEFPKENSFTIGFITSHANTNFSLKVGCKLVAVFVPTTPNPTSGFLLYIDESKIIELNIPVEAAVKLVVSGGIIGADNAAKIKSSPYDKEGGWKWTDLFKRKKPKNGLFDPRD